MYQNDIWNLMGIYLLLGSILAFLITFIVVACYILYDAIVEVIGTIKRWYYHNRKTHNHTDIA